MSKKDFFEKKNQMTKTNYKKLLSMQRVKVNANGANDMNGEVEPILTTDLYFRQNWSSTTAQDKWQSKMLLTIDQCRSKITRYSVLD